MASSEKRDNRGTKYKVTNEHFYLHCSCFQVKSRDQAERSEEEERFQWEILFERKPVGEPEVEPYCLPRWAGTWKYINFAFRQEKKKWDRTWPDYELNLSNKVDKVQELEEQVGINTN